MQADTSSAIIVCRSKFTCPIANAWRIEDHRRMALSHSFSDIIASTAKQKLAAAQARQSPDATAEKPRDAIFGALDVVDRAIAADGFAFARSGPKFSRKAGDLTFEITIQSDRNNVAGQRAAVWVHASVYSRLLTAWRKQHDSEWIRPNAPFPLPLFGTQLGYLCQPSGWMEWDFAEPDKRQSVAEDLVVSIRTGAYSLFSTFEGPIEGIAALSQFDWPPPEGVLSYLLAKGSRALATRAMNEYCDARPDFKMQFEALRDQFELEGLPTYRSATPRDMAAFAVATGFPWK